ncbi:flavodoxin family protein [Chloroflexota bacterium]
MTELVLTKEGQENLDNILRTRAPITRQDWKRRILRVLSLLINEQGCKEAGKDMVIEAAEMVLGKSHSPIFPKLRDPDGYKKRFLARYYDINTYYAGPYELRRWDKLPGKPAKRPEEMKVLAICGSPRKGGNTEALIDEALRAASDAGAKVEKIRLQELNMKYCLGCRKCKEPGFEPICAIKDDMVEVFQKVLDADALIIGFPVYQWRESSQMATFIDRIESFHRTKPNLASSSASPEGQRGKEFQHVLSMYSTLIEPVKRALVIATWGYPYVDAYDDMMERVMTTLSQYNIETVEAISACGFLGILRGLDEDKKAIILRFPKEMEKAYRAGNSLVTGEE